MPKGIFPRRRGEDRIWVRIAKSDTCWIWTGKFGEQGYGEITVDGRRWYAHRLLYTMMRGEIPKGLEIDHLCHVNSCVRPEHLEAVTHRVNMTRALRSVGAVAAAKTHCPRGHEYSAENTIVRKAKYGAKRVCRACVSTEVPLTVRA